MSSDEEPSSASPFLASILEQLREQHPEASDEVLQRRAQRVMQRWRTDMDQPLERDDLTSRSHLRDLKTSGVWGVRVLSERDGQVCPACREANCTIYSIEEALKEAPLPHPACANDACRCVYLPVKHKPWTWEE